MRHRHNILLETIGVWPEETIAFERLRLLCWVLPTFVILATLVDVVLVLLYLYVLHPWTIIFQQVRKFGDIARKACFYCSIPSHSTTTIMHSTSFM